MQLIHISFDDLHISTLNARAKKKPSKPDIDSLATDIRKRGLLQPLLVRAEDGAFGVIAGRRRLLAATKVHDDDATVFPDGIPCAVLASTEDADAIEASLVENTERLPMSALEQCDVFQRLHKTGGLSLQTIAERFAISVTTVRQRLSLAKLNRGVRAAYERDEISDDELRVLTLATPSQQKEWVRLSKNGGHPNEWELRSWILGGHEIDVNVALFDVEASGLATVQDLFKETTYFADSDAFWKHQNTAVAAERDRLLMAGWSSVEILNIGALFYQSGKVRASKSEGGSVYVAIAHNGEVTIHKGWSPCSDTRTGSGTQERPEKRCELSQRAQTYIELHRLALVREALCTNHHVGLRLMIALCIGGMANWSVKPELRAERFHDGDATLDSLDANGAHNSFTRQRRAALELLGLPIDGNTLTDQYGHEELAGAALKRLIALDDQQVLAIASLVVSESLELGSGLVEGLGVLLEVIPDGRWQADDTFFALIRDKAALQGMLAEVAGDDVRDQHLTSTGPELKKLVSSLAEADDTNWVPRYMQFPLEPYTDNGGITVRDRWETMQHVFPISLDSTAESVNEGATASPDGS